MAVVARTGERVAFNLHDGGDDLARVAAALAVSGSVTMRAGAYARRAAELAKSARTAERVGGEDR